MELGKVFFQGGSQAVRIPKELRFPDEVVSVIISKDEKGRLVLEPEGIDVSTAEIRVSWANDPRATFEGIFPEGNRGLVETLESGMRRLLKAKVLPFKPEPNGLSDSGSVPPSKNKRWSFYVEGHGWLDAWALLNSIRQEEYLVQALVGLGVPLDQIASAIAMISGSSAWSGLGAVGWLWAYSKHENVNKGETPWMSQIPGIKELAKAAGLLPKKDHA